jgi:hypothetical protein
VCVCIERLCCVEMYYNNFPVDSYLRFILTAGCRGSVFTGRQPRLVYRA